jgi:hypothetical protein
MATKSKSEVVGSNPKKKPTCLSNGKEQCSANGEKELHGSRYETLEENGNNFPFL